MNYLHYLMTWYEHLPAWGTVAVRLYMWASVIITFWYSAVRTKPIDDTSSFAGTLIMSFVLGWFMTPFILVRLCLRRKIDGPRWLVDWASKPDPEQQS